MARSRFRKFRKLLALVLLVVLALAFWPDRVTIDPPADAPANARPDLPWNLTLVNRDSSLPEGYRFTLTHSRDGVKVDRRIAAELEQMLDAAEAQGFEVHLNAGYRTSAEQRALFDEKTASFQSTDLTNKQPARWRHSGSRRRAPASTSLVSLWTSAQKPSLFTTGSLPNPGATASSSATHRTKPPSPASATSPGTIATSAKVPQARCTPRDCAWRNMCKRSRSESSHVARSRSVSYNELIAR